MLPLALFIIKADRGCAPTGPIINIEFDILFGVTASSYLNFRNMISFLKDKPSNKLYCSLPDTYPPYPMEGVSDIVFGSGAGLFL